MRADTGIFLCAAIKPIGEPAKVFVHRAKNRIDDHKALLEFREEFDKYTLVAGFYNLGFDNKFINSKLLHYGYAPLSEKLTIDLYRVGKRYWATTRRNLDTVARYLKLPIEKTHLDIENNKEAAFNGDEKAMEKLIEHCVKDVEVTELLLDRLAPLIRSISRA